MEKIDISFTPEELNNLVTFMNRTELRGKEVQAFNTIMFNIYDILNKKEAPRKDNE